MTEIVQSEIQQPNTTEQATWTGFVGSALMTIMITAGALVAADKAVVAELHVLEAPVVAAEVGGFTPDQQARQEAWVSGEESSRDWLGVTAILLAGGAVFLGRKDVKDGIELKNRTAERYKSWRNRKSPTA